MRRGLFLSQRCVERHHKSFLRLSSCIYTRKPCYILQPRYSGNIFKVASLRAFHISYFTKINTQDSPVKATDNTEKEAVDKTDQSFTLDDEAKRWLAEVPEVIHLKHPSRDADYFILGTLHDAKAHSSEQVRKLIEFVKPDCILIELDELRAKKLTESTIPLFTLFLQLYEQTKSLPSALQQTLFSLNHRLLGSGQDMIVALQTAEHYNIPIVYGDRSEQETLRLLRDAGEDVNPWDLQMRMGGWIFRGKKADVEKVRRLNQELKQREPNLYRILVEDRNQLIADALLQKCAQKMGAKRIVVVVGMGHLYGVEQILANKVDGLMRVRSNGDLTPVALYNDHVVEEIIRDRTLLANDDGTAEMTLSDYSTHSTKRAQLMNWEDVERVKATSVKAS